MWLRLIVAAVLLAIPGRLEAQTAADLILYNGTVLTISSSHSDPGQVGEALAIAGDSVLAVGSDHEILGLADENTRVVDLSGRSVIPGFVDAHSHIFSNATDRGMTIQQVHGIALANGVTSVGNVLTTAEVLAEMLAFEADNRLRIRTNLYLALTDFCGAYLGNWYRDHPPTPDNSARLRIAGVKLFVDGGTCGDIATSFEYVSGHGNLWRTQNGLNQLVSTVDQAGYQVAMHAQGDRAVEQALNAIAFVSPDGSNPLKHRIEHNSFVRSDLRPRYDATGAVAILFGRFPTCAEVKFGSLSSRYGDANVTWLEDWRSLLDANPNLHAGWHSDYPFFVLDPIQHLASYVTRAQVEDDGSLCSPPGWLSEHSITPIEALALMTRGGAYALDRDHEIGSLEIGKKADLVILSQDPTAVAPDHIIDTEILATFIDGRLMFCRPGSERVCGLPVNATQDLPDQPQTGLDEVHPNPARSQVSLSYSMASAGPVRVSIYDVVGRLVAGLVDGEMPAGRHRVEWTTQNIPAGVYIVMLETRERAHAQRAVVVR